MLSIIILPSSLYLPQAAMTSKKKTTSTSNTDVVPAPTTSKVAPTKQSTPLDVRSTVSICLAPDPTTNLALTSVLPRNTPIPDATNTSVYPTGAFQNTVSNITETLSVLIEPIYFEPGTVLLHLKDLKQELIDDSVKYKAAVPHTKKQIFLRVTFQSIS